MPAEPPRAANRHVVRVPPPAAPGAAPPPPVAHTAAPRQPPPPPPRRGRFTREEETYVAALITCFNCGRLPCELYPSVYGATLRAFLAKELRCDAMRISKKFTGDDALGMVVYERRGECAPGDEAELRRLRAAFQQSVGKSWDPAPRGDATAHFGGRGPPPFGGRAPRPRPPPAPAAAPVIAWPPPWLPPAPQWRPGPLPARK